MGALIAVETSDGKKKLDLAEASRMVVMVGGIEYTILPPNIEPLFRPHNAMFEQAQQRIANAGKMAEESRRRLLDQIYPPKSGQ